MKKAISILGGCLLAATMFAGDNPNMPAPLVITPQTNTSAVAAGQATTDVTLYGWLDAVIIDVGGGETGASPTQTVTIATVGSEGTGPARTLLTLTDITADATYPVRDLVTGVTGGDIANTPARHVLVGDKLIVSSYDASTTTNTLTVYLILDTDN